MQGKKSSLQLYVIVGLVIALVALVSYSFFAQGVVYTFMENIGAVESDLNESMQDALNSEGENNNESGGVDRAGDIFGGINHFENEKEGIRAEFEHYG